MHVKWGVDAASAKQGRVLPVTWHSKNAINGHALLLGMTGSGKTYNLRKMIAQMQQTAEGPIRVHVFDVHGDILIPGASTVSFSERTQWGLNPLLVNPDPDYGGVRKRVQGFISTTNRVMHRMGTKQEAVLRNILYDTFEHHGFKSDDPTTWTIEPGDERLYSEASDGRIYLDVPLGEYPEAKAAGAEWDKSRRKLFVPMSAYKGALVRWPPLIIGRSQPSLRDALRLARHVLQMKFLGSNAEGIKALEEVNKAAGALYKKRIEALRRAQAGAVDDKLQEDLDKTKSRLVDRYTNYVNAITTGTELDDVMKYDSTDVLKSVIDRLENLDAIGILKPLPPPFDPNTPVWHYNISALLLQERKLFVHFQLEELFARAVQRGEQDRIVEVVVLDEAHIYADDDDDNILNTIAKEARKFGLAMICASQSPEHFSDDMLGAMATKAIIGIDETFWKKAISKMRVTEEALKWVRPQKTMLVQLKNRGDTRNEWRWVNIE